MLKLVWIQWKLRCRWKFRDSFVILKANYLLQCHISTSKVWGQIYLPLIMWSIISAARILEIQSQSKKNNLNTAPENIQKWSLSHAHSSVGEPASVKLLCHHPPNFSLQEVHFHCGPLLLGRECNKLGATLPRAEFHAGSASQNHWAPALNALKSERPFAARLQMRGAMVERAVQPLPWLRCCCRLQ